MTIALIGGGEFTPSVTVDAELLALAKTSEVLVLTIAAVFEQPASLVEQARRHFAALGATVVTLPILRRADAVDPATAAVVAKHRFVYLTDGSPMHLRSVLKDTPLLEALRSVAEVGVLAASGASASLMVDPMVDPRGGAFGLGLGLITPMAIVPMHESWSPERSRRTRELAPAHVPVVNLDTGAAIVRTNGAWSAHGTVAVFTGGTEGGLGDLP